MAVRKKKITVQYRVLGGRTTDLALEKGATLGDLKEELGYEKYSASVNGESADDDVELENDDYVTLSEAVKGG